MQGVDIMAPVPERSLPALSGGALPPQMVANLVAPIAVSDTESLALWRMALMPLILMQAFFGWEPFPLPSTEEFTSAGMVQNLFAGEGAITEGKATLQVISP